MIDYYTKNIVEIRNKYIEGNSNLMNNFSTLEIIVFLSLLLGIDLSNRGIDERIIKNLIFSTLKEFNKNNRMMDSFFASCSKAAMQIDDYETLAFIFYTRLFLSNLLGEIIPADTDVLELIENFHSEIIDYLATTFPDAPTYDFQEDLRALVAFIYNKSFEEFGDITGDLQLNNSVEQLSKYIYIYLL